MRVKLFWKNNPTSYSRKGLGFKGALEKGYSRLRDMFKGQLLTGENARELEAEINAWLAERPGIRVAEIKQSASGGSFNPSLWLVSIWYEDSAAQS